jgi:hypothetical protein
VCSAGGTRSRVSEPTKFERHEQPSDAPRVVRSHVTRRGRLAPRYAHVDHPFGWPRVAAGLHRRAEDTGVRPRRVGWTSCRPVTYEARTVRPSWSTRRSSRHARSAANPASYPAGWRLAVELATTKATFAPGADPTVGGTQPTSINDRGQIVGLAYDPKGGSRGFLLKRGVLTMIDAKPATKPPGGREPTATLGGGPESLHHDAMMQ